MLRRLFSLASLLSLLLFLATVVLWLRSYRWLDEFGIQKVDVVPTSGGRSVSVYSGLAEIGSTGGGIYINVETFALRYATDDVRDEIRLEDWKKIEGLHLEHWDQQIVPFENVFPMNSRHILGFHWGRDGNVSLRWPPSQSWTRTAGVPAWVLAVAFFVLPTWRVITGWRAVGEGHCPACGYNLSGNTIGVCPECGTAVAGKAGA